LISFIDENLLILLNTNTKGENVKITKLSLAAIAAMTLTTSAMADITANFSGDAKLWYETADSSADAATITAAGAAADLAAGGGTTAGADAAVVQNRNNGNGLFHQNASGFTGGDAALSVNVDGKAGAFGYGLRYTVVDTLGLENNLVSSRRQAAGVDNGALGTAHWMEKAFLTYQMGKTTAKIGRQHLDTPLAFTEKWNITSNSFDAAVLVNSDIPNTTLIGAYVGKGNGGSEGGVGFTTVKADGRMDEFGTNTYATPLGGVPLVGDGAYAAAALIKPMKDLGVNIWYYDVQDIANAVWLDANYKIAGVADVGAIYAQMMPKTQIAAFDDTKGYAFKAGGKAGPVSLFAAYSSVDDGRAVNGAVLPIANVATGFKKTKLPTAGVYNDGFIVAQPGSDTYKIKAGMPAGPLKLTAQYISTTNDRYNQFDVDEFDFIVGTKIADINVKAIYMNRTFKNDAKLGNVGNSDSDHVRIIAGINF